MDDKAPLVTLRSDMLDRAAVAAAAAETHAGVEIREVADVPTLKMMAKLFSDIWKTGPAEPVNSAILRALAHEGNYIVGAFRGGELLGACAAFLGWRDELSLHCHITGVRPGVRSQGIGFALKLNLRVWAMRRDINTVTWTFDPLVRRNAHFNLVKLGARAAEYLVDFYGSLDDGINSLDDGINADQASDRLFVIWPLFAPDVIELLDCMPYRKAPEPIVRPGAWRRLDKGMDGEPELLVAHFRTQQLCAIPPDIETMRREDPARAGRWRHALRTALIDAQAQGFCIQTLTSSCDYLLIRHLSREAGNWEEEL
ncbi:GNAT family N-acetyltransferase [Streptomyces sp. NRRL B-24484]|uniref:GNAT family N-acetyltransferase n=1 Tax=Streptomyces sp. NRRL B-24484 TaxID=1463833 RepID=UPI0006946817|nr:GNAT family N-acetyltransferase [Streptomyces sp. NRRL B-24484]